MINKHSGRTLIINTCGFHADNHKYYSNESDYSKISLKMDDIDDIDYFKLQLKYAFEILLPGKIILLENKSSKLIGQLHDLLLDQSKLTDHKYQLNIISL